MGEGAVATPGVYELPADARLAHLVAVAGGFTPNADATRLNLAQRLVDEARIAIPTAAAVASEAPAATPAALGFAPVAGVIDINAATAEELESLPGIGPAIAERIIAERERIGGFVSVDDLARVEGISERMVDELRPLITI
jgi:competence protein ComEA